MPHIWVSESVRMGSDNGLSPIRRQVIIWTNSRLLSIEPLETNLSESWIKNKIFIHEIATENIACEIAAMFFFFFFFFYWGGGKVVNPPQRPHLSLFD